MTRAIYRCVVLLHPPDFRRRFADEMTWIFDEATTEMNGATLLTDVLASLVRQWAINPAVWRIVAMGLLSVLPFFPIAFLPRPRRPLVHSISVLSQPDVFLVVMLAPLIAISIGLIFAVGSFRYLQRRRP